MITRVLSRSLSLSTNSLRRVKPIEIGPVEESIRTKLAEEYQPVVLEILNESGNHGFRRGRESHFNVLMVSDVFEGKRAVNRQRMVNRTLKEELGTIHALSCSLRTSEEFSKNNDAHTTPKCGGGVKL